MAIVMKMQTKTSIELNTVVTIFLLIFALFALLRAGSAHAYIPGTEEELQIARKLNFSIIVDKLSSGGISGNLGASLLILFSMIIPTSLSLFFAIYRRYYFLKILQYPALICMIFGVVVLLLQPERWFSGDWALRVISFTFIIGLTFSVISFCLLFRGARNWAVLILASSLLGLGIFSLRGF